MSDLFSRMNPFRAASPTKLTSRPHSRSQSRNEHLAPRTDSRSGSHRASEDTRRAFNSTGRPLPTFQTAHDLRPPISPPGRLRSTSHPSLGSIGSSRRKPAPAPLDLSLSRHKGVHAQRVQPILQQPSPLPAMEVTSARSRPDGTYAGSAWSRPATSHGMYAHARSQSHHLPALPAFGMDGPPRPASALDSTLPSFLRGQYLLDMHKSIELDRPVYTPIDRASFDVAGVVGGDLPTGAYERRATSAAAFVESDLPVSNANDLQATAMDEKSLADQTPRNKAPTSTTETTPSRSLSKSAKTKSLSKKPSILRTLAHHPSLSALRRKKKDKELALLEDRHADTPDLVGGADADEMGTGTGWTSRGDTATPTPGLPHGQSKSLWGSVKRKSKSKKGQDGDKGEEREREWRGVKSIPGLRMSSESSDSNWRSSTDLRTPLPTEPVPAIPAQYAKSAIPMANAALSALVASSTSVFDRPASSMASVSNSKDSHGAVSGEGDPDLTPQKQLRLRRGRSEDLSPAGKLGAKYTSPNRHLSTPPVSRIKPISPPRHSMPPGTGTSASPGDGPFWDLRARDSLPLHLHSRRMSVGSETDAEYNEDDYGDLPSTRDEEGGMDDGSPVRKTKPTAARAISPSPTSAATAGSAYTGDGLTPCPTPTLPPPPRSKTTTPYTARRKCSSMPIPSGASATKTPTSTRAVGTPGDTPSTVNTATGISTPANSAASRAESPFEVKISPMVAKRMSLDAFGTSSSALVGVGGQVVENGESQRNDEDGMEELEEKYEEIALDEDADSDADDGRSRASFRDRSRSRSLSRTPHKRAQEYEDPDSVYGAGENDGYHTDIDINDESEVSFDGASGGHPYASHGYGQSFGLNGIIGAAPNTLEGWVGTQLTTIKEFPSTATLDYIPDIPDLEISNSIRRQSLVRSSGVVQGLAEHAETGQRMVRSPRLSDGLAGEGDVSIHGVGGSGSMRRSPALPFGLSDRSMSTATEQSDADQSVAPEGSSMYRTPLPARVGGVPSEGGIAQTPWTAKSGMTAFFTPLSYPVPGHQQGDTSTMSGTEVGEESPCAGREVSKSVTGAQKASSTHISGTTPGPASTQSTSARSFSSASRRLRIKHSSLPPIADEGVDITVQHNEQLSALELRLAEVVKERKEKEEQYETLRRRLSDVERQRRAAEDGREEMSKMMGVKERQASDSASSVRQMRQALSDYETAFDRLQVAHDDLADRLAAAQQAIEMAQAEKIDVQSEIQVLASGTAVMANRIRELEEELGDARAQSRSVAAERLWNSGEVNELRSDLHMVKRQSEMNLGALNKAQAKLQEKETLVSLRESEVASVKGELQEMQVKIIGLQRAMVEKDRTIEMCRDKVASKQYELDEVVVKLDGLSKEKQGLEREVQELREEILVIKVRGDEGWAEQRDEMQAEIDGLRSDLALKEQLEQGLDILDSQLSVSEAQTAALQHQLETARAELEAKSGDLSLTSGEVDQLHAELEAANERAERLEASKSRMEREHKRALGEAKWDVNEAREQLRAANDKLQEALIEREVSNAATKDSASRLTAYLDEIERLERELGTLKGGLEDKADEDKGRDHELERMREEMRAMREDKELLNIALESKTMEVALLQRQLPKTAQGASARAGHTTPKKRLAASTSRLSMSERGGEDVTPKAADTSLRLAKSAMGPPSAVRSTRTSLAGPGRPTSSVKGTSTSKAKRASMASVDESSDTSFASAHSALGSSTSRIPTAFPLRGGLKNNRRESSVMGPSSHAPASSSIGRSRQQSLGLGAARSSTATPSSGTQKAVAGAAGPSERERSTSSVLRDSTKQNRPASAMAMSMTGAQVSPSKIPTFARGPLPRISGRKDLALAAELDQPHANELRVNKVGESERAVSVSSMRSAESAGWTGGRVNADGHFGL